MWLESLEHQPHQLHGNEMISSKSQGPRILTLESHPHQSCQSSTQNGRKAQPNKVSETQHCSLESSQKTSKGSPEVSTAEGLRGSQDGASWRWFMVNRTEQIRKALHRNQFAVIAEEEQMESQVGKRRDSHRDHEQGELSSGLVCNALKVRRIIDGLGGSSPPLTLLRCHRERVEC